MAINRQLGLRVPEEIHRKLEAETTRQRRKVPGRTKGSVAADAIRLGLEEMKRRRSRLTRAAEGR